MRSFLFFFGHGKMRYWYVLFYITALPVYIFGIYLLTKLQASSHPEIREIVLNIFSLGYFLLGLFSLINTIIYIHITKHFFLGFSIFIGIQVLFWMIGYTLGNNYIALTFFFIIFLLLAVYGNLKALSYVHKHKEIALKHISK